MLAMGLRLDVCLCHMEGGVRLACDERCVCVRVVCDESRRVECEEGRGREQEREQARLRSSGLRDAISDAIGRVSLA